MGEEFREDKLLPSQGLSREQEVNWAVVKREESQGWRQKGGPSLLIVQRMVGCEEYAISGSRWTCYWVNSPLTGYLTALPSNLDQFELVMPLQTAQCSPGLSSSNKSRSLHHARGKKATSVLEEILTHNCGNDSSSDKSFRLQSDGIKV